MTDHFDFSHALALLKQGKRVASESWREWSELEYLELQRDENGQRLVVHGIYGDSLSLATGYLLADDWHEVTG